MTVCGDFLLQIVTKSEEVLGIMAKLPLRLEIM